MTNEEKLAELRTEYGEMMRDALAKKVQIEHLAKVVLSDKIGIKDGDDVFFKDWFGKIFFHSHPVDSIAIVAFQKSGEKRSVIIGENEFDKIKKA